MPADIIGASRTSDIPRLAEMNRVAAGLPSTDGGSDTFPNGITANGDLLLAAAPRIKTTGSVPTVGSGGSGVSVLSVVAGSTNVAGGVLATLTSIAPGVVIGVVAFAAALASAPLFVICSLALPTAGVAAPPVVGADTYTVNGFTIRSYGPTTVTTGAYQINWVAFF